MEEVERQNYPRGAREAGTNAMTTVRVLIVGKNPQRTYALLRRLDGWSWDFYFAETCAEVMPLLKGYRFDSS